MSDVTTVLYKAAGPPLLNKHRAQRENGGAGSWGGGRSGWPSCISSIFCRPSLQFCCRRTLIFPRRSSCCLATRSCLWQWAAGVTVVRCEPGNKDVRCWLPPRVCRHLIHLLRRAGVRLCSGEQETFCLQYLHCLLTHSVCVRACVYRLTHSADSLAAG